MNPLSLAVALFLSVVVIGSLPKQLDAGFFDQVIQQTLEQSLNRQKQQPANRQEPPPPQQEQSPPSNRGGLVDGFGSLLGLSQRDIDLVNRGIKTVQALQPIGEEAEQLLGQAVSLEALSRYGGIYRHPGLTRYVNMVGLTVAEVSDRPDLQYHFAILNSDQENAFAAPGGYIFITLGLLKNLADESELATVLAHEIAHVNRKHMLNTIQRSSLLSNVSELSMTVLDRDSKLLGNLIDQVSDILFTHGIDKDLEFEADHYGVEYAYRAGYSPKGINSYLKRLQKQQGTTSSIFFTTHPPIGERISRISQKLAGIHGIERLAILSRRFNQQIRPYN